MIIFIGLDFINVVIGGIVVLLNYFLMSSCVEFFNGSLDYFQVVFEGGININDWMLCSY